MSTIANGAANPTAPGYPRPDPCISFWLQGTRGSQSLLGHRTTEDLPASAEVAIIGSGISGAATAYFLLTGPNPPKSVVMLEARELCYGATGRNGGHCRPDCYRGYTGYKAHFGKDQAMKILQNEMDTLNLVTEIIDKEGLRDVCDFWRGLSFDVAMDQECKDFFYNSYKEFIADGGKVEGIVEWIEDAAEAEKRTRSKGAVAAAEFPAASLWPYKLVTALIKLCIDKHGLNVQTNTPVRSVSEAEGDAWLLKTDRGDLKADKVVYATNAFTATLLPEFIGRIAPYRGQCSAVVPTKPFSGSKMLTHTYSHRYGVNDFDYMIQRPKDGVIIIGGGRWKVPVDQLIGNTDDTSKIPVLTEHLKGSMASYMTGWGEEKVGEGLLVDWTGIMGYTPEAVPYVGALHGKRNAYISAGHSGHGMARTFTCSRGIAMLIRGESWAATGLPECFEPTPERLARPKETVEETWVNTREGQPMMH
ncbi:FAD dependent oxidoreductase [Cylindrobasidium torrendii FP15055 ss-10]|uniref:FAD dependent oxidoreductase n=1 Tax=Cylindrobasidium torrendii FP15055 ss-10 TaxID=1314674 RepID=A0A0D7BPW5_9AGAR|nr:FAD dependent oxidoreductase [Cylindrobasidium torrendii FP15055 ss-10]